MDNFNLRDFQRTNLKENESAKKREDDYNLQQKLKKEEDELMETQRLEKESYINNVNITINEITNNIKNIVGSLSYYLTTSTESNFIGRYTEALIFVDIIKNNILNIRNNYVKYTEIIHDVESKYEFIIVDDKYNNAIKEEVNKINISIYNKLVETSGIAHDDIKNIIKEIFDMLEDMGADHIDLTMEDTNVNTIKILAESLREERFTKNEIIKHLSELYSVEEDYISSIISDMTFFTIPSRNVSRINVVPINTDIGSDNDMTDDEDMSEYEGESDFDMNDNDSDDSYNSPLPEVEQERSIPANHFVDIAPYAIPSLNVNQLSFESNEYLASISNNNDSDTSTDTDIDIVDSP